MKIERLPSGSYRSRKMYKGKTYTVLFDHKPTQKEVTLALAEKMELDEVSGIKKSSSFEYALDEYIELRSNILSPSTIKGYRQLKNMYSDEFLHENIFDINQDDIQCEVNRYALNHSSKSVRNFHGLLSAVISSKRPNMRICTTLPEKDDSEAVIPTHEDVMKILEALHGTNYYIPVYLGCHGLRRSEILALTMDDLQGNLLTINKAMVENDNKEYVVKKTKTSSGTRTIALAQDLVDAINKQGYIYQGHPNNIIRVLHKTQDKLNIPRCKLHELRHFYVSYAHDLGMSDANLIYSIGHKTDEITKKVYRHKMNYASEQLRIANSLNCHDKIHDKK